MNSKIVESINILLITLICVLSGVAQANEKIDFQKVDPNQIPAELMMLSVATKTNYEKIKTWQGNMDFHDVIISKGQDSVNILEQHTDVKSVNEPNELMTLYEGTVEFKIDAKNDCRFVHTVRPQPVTYTDPEKERVYTSLSGSWEQTKIVTPECEIISNPSRWTENNTIVTRRNAIRQKASMRKTTGSDPRESFNVGSPVWLLLSQLSQSLRQKREGVETYDVILEEGKTAENKLVYHIQMFMPGQSYPILKFILKEDAGFNPTYIEARRNGLLISRVTTDFVKIDGIFLPSKRQEMQYDESGLRRDSQRTINNTQINAQLPDKTFSIDNCGLEDGDSFVDEINNKSYIYKGEGKLVEIKKEE